MSTAVIVGAGPGLGLEIARLFGTHGFSVALVARTQITLDELADRLGAEGIDARGFPADITDAASLTTAFSDIRNAYGSIDFFEFSPADRSLPMAEVLDLTPENVQSQIDFYVYGAINAAQQVIPEMVERGAGAMIFTTGGGSVAPTPRMGNINIAAAGLRNWVLNLHGALAPKGVYVAYVAIGALIGSGRPEAEASVIAQEYWKLYQARDQAELHYVARPDDRH
jgi:NAD(P)-dependent dehydrogenase (short-subunit alcohol dehydrogenase family)